MPDDAQCLQCSLIDDAERLPGGVVAELGGWIVFHAPGSWNLGTMALLPRRHVARVAELTDDEAATLGRLLRDVAAAVTAVREPSQVYVNQWAHRGGVATHVHFLVQPIDGELMAAHPGLLGPALQVQVIETSGGPAAEDVARVAADARRFLTSRQS